MPAGDLFVHEGKMHFAGLINGNIFITIQPPRGYFENIDKIYHDFYLSPPHHYLAHYRWIKDVFRADAVMHVGKHGSLEWLPGKALGLSDACYPDLAIMDLPNVYPYIINDPSEGTQAKRRSYCCIIDHLTPKLPVLRPMIWEALKAADLHKDLEISEKDAFADFDALLEKLHGYLAMINDGLHIMGKSPEEDRLVEFLVQLTRLPNGGTPSLRESALNALGYDYDDLLENKGKSLLRFQNKTGGQIIQSAHEKGLAMVKALEESRFDAAGIDAVVESHLGRIAAVLRYICEILTPNIRRVTDEIDSSLTGFDAISGGSPMKSTQALPGSTAGLFCPGRRARPAGGRPIFYPRAGIFIPSIPKKSRPRGPGK